MISPTSARRRRRGVWAAETARRRAARKAPPPPKRRRRQSGAVCAPSREQKRKEQRGPRQHRVEREAVEGRAGAVLDHHAQRVATRRRPAWISSLSTVAGRLVRATATLLPGAVARAGPSSHTSILALEERGVEATHSRAATRPDRRLEDDDSGASLRRLVSSLGAAPRDRRRLDPAPALVVERGLEEVAALGFEGDQQADPRARRRGRDRAYRHRRRAGGRPIPAGSASPGSAPALRRADLDTAHEVGHHDLEPRAPSRCRAAATGGGREDVVSRRSERARSRSPRLMAAPRASRRERR